MSRRRGEQQPNAVAMIPPLEIGSFVALGSGRSEFIGSASGVFFADTVFRAFANLPASPGLNDGEASLAGSSQVPESAYGCFGGSENPPRQAAGGNPSPEAAPIDPQLTEDTRPCGLSILGATPPPDTARRLVMTYFRFWHPVFPFLHGPSFLEDVNAAYADGQDGDKSDCSSRYSYDVLCRAIKVQCILNIAATAPGFDLDPSHRIQSTQGLMQLLGPVYCSPDIASLQALLAAELYLITIMSLRAASTIHGVLTRIIYNMGLHRCPFRYGQLPEEKRAIRKRIFWCAYIFDRHIGQALGHPLGFNDSDIDVCIPGMEEMHRPVAVTASNQSQEGHSQEVLAHLPIHQQHGSTMSDVGSEALGNASPDVTGQSVVGADRNEAILGFVAAHAKLLGEILDLFHRSIHDRMVIQETVQDITYRVHAWWNGLPSAFQTRLEGLDSSLSSSPSSSPHGIFFTTLYNHTLLLINRPFLSLPRQKIIFKSSLQLAINSAHLLLSHLERHARDVFVMSWPCTLSAVWTAGLVTSFSALLGQYPYQKAQTDILHCLAILKGMADNWTSAGQCHAALDVLYGKLRAHYARRENELHPGEPSGQGKRSYDAMLQGAHHTKTSHVTDSNQTGPRRQVYRGADMDPNNIFLGMQTESDSFGESYFRNPQNWVSLPQYIGPDFGFDMSQTANGLFEGQDMTNLPFNGDFGSLFQSMS